MFKKYKDILNIALPAMGENFLQMLMGMVKKCKKRKLPIGTQTLLLESFARSAARDARKLYNLENSL